MIDVALQREDLIIVKRYLKAEPHANGVVDLIRRSIITLLDHFLLGLHYIYKHAGSFWHRIYPLGAHMAILLSSSLGDVR